MATPKLEELKDDLKRVSEYKPPVKRAAYSDRIAWLMAVFSELAYTRFDEENQNPLLNPVSVADGIDNKVLQSVLRCGGFELKGVFNNPGTDTQGFVAVRRADDGTGMAVLSFRGTEKLKDWITNIRRTKVPVKEGYDVGSVHKGFHKAFKSIEKQVDDYLDDCGDFPIYVTGHSLAILATWFISGKKLAACYTFGSPRVGDKKLLDQFRTPIYRIVNGADPVPLVPKIGYRHYGFQRYLSVCKEGEKGDYPKLMVKYDTGVLEGLCCYLCRFLCHFLCSYLWRFSGQLLRGELTKQLRIDKHHYIFVYRRKLRAFAIRRQRRQ